MVFRSPGRSAVRRHDVVVRRPPSSTISWILENAIVRFCRRSIEKMVAGVLMTDEQQEDAFQQLVKRIDQRAKLLRKWPLTGGVSARVTALEVEQPDEQRQKLIVRQHG